MRLTCFVGIDQTGAVTKSGDYRPLPAAVIWRDENQLRLDLTASGHLGAAYLPELCRESLLLLLKNKGLKGRDLSTTGVAVDSVLGLPAKVWPEELPDGPEGLFELFSEARSINGKGRVASHSFFKQFLNEHGGAEFPRRKCEELANANSVFQQHPFQKNIGTGTFRIWQDLTQTPDKWFQVWPFDDSAGQLQDGPWLFEAYPSFLWQRLFSRKSRQPEILAQLIQKTFPEITMTPEDQRILSDPDHADAAVAALGLYWAYKTQQLDSIPNSSWVKKEGWILGLSPDFRKQA